MTTAAHAAALVDAAIRSHGVVTVQCPNGDTITASATQVIRWGRSRWADPAGREVAGCGGALVVEHCGRGNAAKAARAVLADHEQPDRTPPTPTPAPLAVQRRALSSAIRPHGWRVLKYYRGAAGNLRIQIARRCSRRTLLVLTADQSGPGRHVTVERELAEERDGYMGTWLDFSCNVGCRPHRDRVEAVDAAAWLSAYVADNPDPTIRTSQLDAPIAPPATRCASPHGAGLPGYRLPSIDPCWWRGGPGGI